MTIGQSHELAQLMMVIKWSLVAMAIVLIACIVQYTIYQPWWKDQVGFTVVLLEVMMLAQVLPQLYGDFFVKDTQGIIDLAWSAIIIAEGVTLALGLRFVTWFRVQRGTPHAGLVAVLRERRRKGELDGAS